jgi:ABC-type glycerol-3-phosphate transport system substrate-binding protein
MAITRRGLLKWGLLASGTAALAACGSSATPTPAPAAKPAAAEPTKPAAAAAATTAPAAASAAATKPAEAAKPADAAKPDAAKPAAGAAGAKPGVTVRLHMRAGGEKSEPAIYVDRPGEWEQETGHKVKLEPIPGGKDYMPKILALAASNTLGDSLFTGDSYSEHTTMVRAGVIEPVDAYLTKYNIKKDEWVKAIIDTLTHEGKMYGLPKAANPADSFLTVNLKMFDEAGIKRPDTYGTTHAQLQDWALKLSKGPKDRRDVYGYYANAFSNQSVTNGVRQFGGDLIDKDGVTSLVDQQPFMDWLTWTQNLIVKEKVHPSADVVKTGDSSALAAMFAAGKLAMAHSHRAWVFGFRQAVQDKFEWAIIQWPRGPKALGWVSNVDTHSGTSTSKLKDETFGLIYALADRRFAYLVAKTQGYLTGRVDNLDAIKELANDPFIKVQQKNTEEEQLWWRAKNLRAYEIEAELVNQLDLVWLGKREPDKQFVGELKKGLDAILAKPVA